MIRFSVYIAIVSIFRIKNGMHLKSKMSLEFYWLANNLALKSKVNWKKHSFSNGVHPQVNHNRSGNMLGQIIL